MNKRRRIAIAVVVLAVIVAAITFTVRRGNDDDVIFASGTVEATRIQVKALYEELAG